MFGDLELFFGSSILNLLTTHLSVYGLKQNRFIPKNISVVISDPNAAKTKSFFFVIKT